MNPSSLPGSCAVAVLLSNRPSIEKHKTLHTLIVLMDLPVSPAVLRWPKGGTLVGGARGGGAEPAVFGACLKTTVSTVSNPCSTATERSTLIVQLFQDRSVPIAPAVDWLDDTVVLCVMLRIYDGKKSLG